MHRPDIKERRCCWGLREAIKGEQDRDRGVALSETLGNESHCWILPADCATTSKASVSVSLAYVASDLLLIITLSIDGRSSFFVVLQAQ